MSAVYAAGMLALAAAVRLAALHARPGLWPPPPARLPRRGRFRQRRALDARAPRPRRLARFRPAALVSDRLAGVFLALVGATAQRRRRRTAGAAARAPGGEPELRDPARGRGRDRDRPGVRLPARLGDAHGRDLPARRRRTRPAGTRSPTPTSAARCSSWAAPASSPPSRSCTARRAASSSRPGRTRPAGSAAPGASPSSSCSSGSARRSGCCPSRPGCRPCTAPRPARRRRRSRSRSTPGSTACGGSSSRPSGRGRNGGESSSSSSAASARSSASSTPSPRTRSSGFSGSRASSTAGSSSSASVSRCSASRRTSRASPPPGCWPRRCTWSCTGRRRPSPSSAPTASRGPQATATCARWGASRRACRATALGFGLAVLTLAAMPPFGGFVSEWFTLEALLQSFRLDSTVARLTMALGRGDARPHRRASACSRSRSSTAASSSAARGARSEHVRELPGSAPRSLALAVVALGLGAVAPWEIRWLGRGLEGVLGFDLSDDRRSGSRSCSAPSTSTSPSSRRRGSRSASRPSWTVSALLVRLVLRPPVRRAPVWVSGTSGEIGTTSTRRTATPTRSGSCSPAPTGFARTLEPADPSGAERPRALRTRVVPAFEEYLYRPVTRTAPARLGAGAPTTVGPAQLLPPLHPRSSCSPPSP